MRPAGRKECLHVLSCSMHTSPAMPDATGSDRPRSTRDELAHRVQACVPCDDLARIQQRGGGGACCTNVTRARRLTQAHLPVACVARIDTSFTSPLLLRRWWRWEEPGATCVACIMQLTSLLSKCGWRFRISGQGCGKAMSAGQHIIECKHATRSCVCTTPA